LRSALRQIEWLIPARNFVDGLVHQDARTDPLVTARHAAFMTSHMSAGLMAFACFPPYLALRGVLTLPEAAAFALLVSPILIAIYLSRTGRFEMANIFSSLVLCALAALIAAKTGGIGSFALAWLFVVPVEAALSGSRRVVCYAVGMSVATISTISSVDGMGLLSTPTGLAASPLFHAAGMIAAAAYAGGLALLDHGLHNFGSELTRSGEARYAMLADNMNDLVTRHGRTGQITYASPAALALIGLTPESLLGQGLFERVHVSDRPAYLSALSQAETNAIATTIEFRLRREGSGNVAFIWVEMRCRPFGAGEARHVVGVLRDISERKAHELETEAAKLEAERANAAKSRFLATMSHELRTPLNAVIGFSEMLMNEASMRLDIDRRREYAELIRDSGHHLLAVVNGVLDMSKIETGNFQLVAEPFALKGLVENCRNMMVLKAESSGITIDMSISGDVAEIVADKRACKQIYLNLMSNALKFTRTGGRVTVGARVERHGVALFVADTGVGIARDDLPRLGEAFFQATSTYDRPFEGTGLGLSVVKGLAQLHGGRMEVESVPGRGTLVTVRLPLDCEDQASRDCFANFAKVMPIAPRLAQTELIATEELGKKRA
jgi:cell cycle sensor histidine kinase DivJ